MAHDKPSGQPVATSRPSTSTPNPSNFEKRGGWPIGGGGQTPAPNPNGDSSKRPVA